jgi:hypothetical protein
VRLRYNWGGADSGSPPGVITLRRSKDRSFGDGKWHKVVMFKSVYDTTLVVDRVLMGSGSDGNLIKDSSGGGSSRGRGGKRKKERIREDNSSISSSYVYVGGLPSWYGDKMSALVLPTVLLEKRFRGAVRDLKYKDVLHDEITVQDMVAYKVRGEGNYD